MVIRFLVEVEVNKTSGKFAAREEVTEVLMESLDNDPGSIYVGDNSEYEVVMWEVSEYIEPKATKQRRKKANATP